MIYKKESPSRTVKPPGKGIFIAAVADFCSLAYQYYPKGQIAAKTPPVKTGGVNYTINRELLPESGEDKSEMLAAEAIDCVAFNCICAVKSCKNSR